MRTMDALPAMPEPWVTWTPAACPCRAASNEGVWTAVISLESIVAMEPVTSFLRCTPYPTTTDSFNITASSDKRMFLITVSPFFKETFLVLVR